MTSLAERIARERPVQAVILAGGRGERMRPLTDAVPKPMIEIHGRPFLEYLVDLLREQGITRVLLLLGYRADVIQRHFGDGARWGIEISYLVSDESDETGRRLALARESLDPVFLLLYGDNYWPLRLDPMWKRFQASGAPAMVTVYLNRDRMTRSNVRLEGERVIEYDPTRTSPGLSGVEIGFALISEAAVAPLSGANQPFGKLVLTPLAARGELLAYPTEHRHYTIGSPEALARTTAFLARAPAVILDRDGVLNQRPARAEYVRSWDEFRWLPGSKEALRLFKEHGYRVIVATNQPGVARGALSETDLVAIHERMCAEAAAAGGGIDRIYACLHNWDEGCECRKPRPGLIYEAQHDLDLDLTATFLIGDDERDETAARAAGCPARLVSDSVSLLDHARAIIAARTSVN